MDNNLKEQKNKFSDILNKIESNEIKIETKLHFTLKAILLILVILSILAISIFIFNFILFNVRISNQESLLAFGPRGILAYLRFFPWPMFILDLILIVVLQWIIRSFKFGYKTPTLYMIFGIMILVLLFGSLIDRGTDLNDRILRRADQERLMKPFGRFYGSAHKMPPLESGICKCIVTSIENNILTVKDTNGEGKEFKVLLPMNDLRATSTAIQVGDTVLIAGDKEGDIIRAFGLKNLSPR